MVNANGAALSKRSGALKQRELQVDTVPHQLTNYCH